MTSTLRILVMADGNSVHTEQWIKGLTRTGAVEVSLLTMNPAGIRKGITDNPQVRSAQIVAKGPVSPSGSNYHYLRNIGRMRRIVRELRPDVITTIYLTSYGFIGALCKQRSLLCHFMIGSDIMVAPERGVVNRLVARYALAKGDYFVSSSQTMSRRIRQLAAVPDDRLLTQQYGVGDEIIGHPHRTKDHDFVSNRAWVPNSNIPRILELVASLPPTVTMAIIGDGGPQEEQIKMRLRSLPNVRHLGLLPYRENIDAVARSRYFLSLTSSDGASLSLMEAMALGAIPVVSNIEPNREWVQDGVNGFLLDIEDTEGSARKIMKILSLTEAECDTMRRRNRQIILERGSLSVNMGRLLANITHLLGTKGRP